jgi:Flp pilus assembly protein TadG
MRTNRKLRSMESGQIIPLVVVGIIVIIAMAALLIDGGMLISNRRSAQAAADAGAMAGAKQLCLGEDDATVISVAQQYATNENEATSVVVSIIDQKVHVTATVLSDTLFSNILNRSNLTAKAKAVSGCFGPRGKAVMPLAWNCRAPTVGGPFDPNAGCKIQTLDWDDLLRPLVEGEVGSIEIDGRTYAITPTGGHNITRSYIAGVDNASFAGKKIPPRQIYIVMDSEKVCEEAGMDCDIDNDGKNDIELGGNRGWLYLTDDTHIKQWIENPQSIELKVHSWLSGKPGDVESAFKAMEDLRQGEVVLIPVYNVWCKNDKTPLDNAACMTAAHDPAYWPPEPPEGDNADEVRGNDNYHIVTFAPFYISCASKKGNCPGATLAMILNPLIKNNTSSVEGFFLHNIDLAVEITQDCDVNIGSCTVSLIE